MLREIAACCIIVMALLLAQVHAQHERRRTHHLDNPAGDFDIEALGGDTQVTLTGKIRVLRLASIDGAAVLDASELLAAQIVVRGEINGGSRMMLNAPGGSVHILGDVNGGAHVEINAPDGTVVLGTEKGGIVGGGTRLHITTRDLHMAATGTGGTHINVTFTEKGTLKFTRLDGGAHINWRMANRDTGKPKIEPGTVLDGAACGQEGQEPDFKPDHGNNRPEERPEPRPGNEREKPPVPPKPVDVGPMIAAGVIDVDGQHIAGEFLSVDEERVHLHLPDGKAEKIALQRVAVILLRPTPESARAMLDRGSAGLLLRGGDFVDGNFKSLDGQRLSMSSVLFGIKRFEVGSEAIALVIRRQNGQEKKAP